MHTIEQTRFWTETAILFNVPSSNARRAYTIPLHYSMELFSDSQLNIDNQIGGILVFDVSNTAVLHAGLLTSLLIRAASSPAAGLGLI